ncbi:hypothetical protein BGZ60DRAFT_521850 [Tricladium varicosporioides]|nr:hypothetical protein BGZ60DRAFT_521850 [Hymenoscyphus varicosporioides]
MAYADQPCHPLPKCGGVRGVVQKTLTTIIHKPSESDDDDSTNHQKTAKEPRMASKIPGICLGTQYDWDGLYGFAQTLDPHRAEVTLWTETWATSSTPKDRERFEEEKIAAIATNSYLLLLALELPVCSHRLHTIADRSGKKGVAIKIKLTNHFSVSEV